jgi:hypothetical protein
VALSSTHGMVSGSESFHQKSDAWLRTGKIDHI